MGQILAISLILLSFFAHGQMRFIKDVNKGKPNTYYVDANNDSRMDYIVETQENGFVSYWFEGGEYYQTFFTKKKKTIYKHFAKKQKNSNLFDVYQIENFSPYNENYVRHTTKTRDQTGSWIEQTILIPSIQTQCVGQCPSGQKRICQENQFVNEATQEKQTFNQLHCGVTDLLYPPERSDEKKRADDNLINCVALAQELKL